MRLGVLGGTFDPVHNGHLRLGIEAKEIFDLDEVVLEIAAISPFKLETEPTDGRLRYEMVSHALEGTKMRAGDCELKRGGTSYSVDTIEGYAKEHEVWCIVGADALKGLPKWKDPDRLLELCRMAVGFRPGDHVQETLASFPAPWRESIDVFPCPLLDISSTGIRSRVRAGRSIRFLTPDSVVQTIEKHRLYK